MDENGRSTKHIISEREEDSLIQQVAEEVAVLRGRLADAHEEIEKRGDVIKQQDDTINSLNAEIDRLNAAVVSDSGEVADRQ